MAGSNGSTARRARKSDALEQLGAAREALALVCDESNLEVVRAIELDLAAAEDALRAGVFASEARPTGMSKAEFVALCPLLPSGAADRLAREAAAAELLSAAAQCGGRVLALPEWPSEKLAA